MGLIKAAIGATGGVLADQWKEFFYCDSLTADVLAVRGQKKTSKRSSNTKGYDNVISNGSLITVADGQCMLITEQGKVVEVSAEPGEYVYDKSTEPSIFAGSLGKSILDTFKNIGKRFTFGGEAPKDQRVYYINIKELIGNKYGTPSPVPFRVVDERAAIDIDIAIRCFGEYSYAIKNPLLFYTNVCGNVEEAYTRDRLDSQLKSELLTALQPAFARISAKGIRYSALPGHTTELSEALKEELSEKWRDIRGIEICAVGVSSVKADEEDEKMIKEMQRNTAFTDPTRAAAHLVGAQANAMQSAAKNENGAMMGFMGMGMAQNAGNFNPQNLYAMGAAQEKTAPATPSVPAAEAWKCTCGHTVIGKFCPECGSKKPEEKKSWRCSCGEVVESKFCPNCGNKKPAEEGWTCSSCGAVNKGKFCAECGSKKPSGIPQYQCDKCGWKPQKGSTPPRFCPECGDPFDNGDII